MSDPRAIRADSRARTSEIQEKIQKALAGIRIEDGRYVLKSRFGIDTGVQKTLEEIGKDLGKTRERVRQIEVVAKREFAFELMLLMEPIPSWNPDNIEIYRQLLMRRPSDLEAGVRAIAGSSSFSIQYSEMQIREIFDFYEGLLQKFLKERAQALRLSLDIDGSE